MPVRTFLSYTTIPLVVTTFGKLGSSAESYLQSSADVAPVSLVLYIIVFQHYYKLSLIHI